MKKPMTLTAFLVTCTFIVFGLYDLTVCCLYGTESSISRFMQTVGFTNPPIILVIGYILGHFWGTLRPAAIDDLKQSKLLIKEMAERLEEVDELGFDKTEKVYYWKSCGSILRGQCNRKNLGEKK